MFAGFVENLSNVRTDLVGNIASAQKNIADAGSDLVGNIASAQKNIADAGSDLVEIAQKNMAGARMDFVENITSAPKNLVGGMKKKIKRAGRKMSLLLEKPQEGIADAIRTTQIFKQVVLSPRNIAKTWEVGSKVEIYSNQLDKWLKGTIVQTNGENEVVVHASEGQWRAEKTIDRFDSNAIRSIVKPPRREQTIFSKKISNISALEGEPQSFTMNHEEDTEEDTEEDSSTISEVSLQFDTLNDSGNESRNCSEEADFESHDESENFFVPTPRIMKHGQLNESYTFEKKLGEGGQGEVYLVRDKAKVRYAIKKMDAEHEQFYLQEITLLCNCKNDHIVELQGTFRTQEHLYMLFPYARGGNYLDRIMDKSFRHQMTESVVAGYIKQAMEGIHYLHNVGIVHRDIKPENMMFLTPEIDSRLVIIDLGVAQHIGAVKPGRKPKVFDTSGMVGTADYMSPELLTKDEMTQQELFMCDIWSIFVMTYETFMKRIPWKGCTCREIWESILDQKIELPPGGHSPALKDFIERGLSRDYSKRLTLDQTLHHPWIIQEQLDTHNMEHNTVHSLRQLDDRSDLKNAISALLAKHVQNGEEKIRSNFEQTDLDGNGAIDLGELTTLMMNLGWSEDVSHREAQKMLQANDMNNDRKIDYPEFKAAWTSRMLKQYPKFAEAVFNRLDTNGDNKLSLGELWVALRDFASMEQINDMILAADKNRDGYLQLDEFMHVMEELVPVVTPV